MSKKVGFLAAIMLSIGVLVSSAEAEGTPPVPADVTPIVSSPVTAVYAVYVHGLHALNVTASYQLQPWGYGATATIQSVGLASWFLKMHLTARTQGHFTSTGVIPVSYQSDGFSRGAERHVKLVYTNDIPTVTVMDPPEIDREPVPLASLPHTIDTLSGMVNLLRTISQTGQCNGNGTVFDGLRLTRMIFHGPVIDTLARDHDAFYSGSALRCDFTGQQLAGFVKDSPNREKMSQAKPGSAWFQKIDGFGLVPVRIEIEHPKLGHVTVVMQQAVRH